MRNGGETGRAECPGLWGKVSWVVPLNLMPGEGNLAGISPWGATS